MKHRVCPLLLIAGVLVVPGTARAYEDDPDPRANAIPPVVSNGRVFFLHDGGKQLLAVDPVRKAKVWTWTAPAKTPGESLLAYAPQKLLIVRTAATTLAVDQTTGRTRWTLPCQGETLATGAVVLVNCPGGLRAVSAPQGTALWQRAGAPLRVFLVGEVLHVALGTSLSAVDAATGKPTWTLKVTAHDQWIVSGTVLYGFGTPPPPGKAAGQLPARSTVTAIDLIKRRRIWTRTYPRVAELHPAGDRLILGLGRGLMAVKASTGAPLWTRLVPVTKYDQNPSDLQVHRASDTVVCAEMQPLEHMYHTSVVAVDVTTGKRRYERDFLKDEHDGIAAIRLHGRHVLVLRFFRNASLHALKPGFGRLSWSVALHGVSEGYPPGFAIDGDTLYYRSAEPELYAMDLATGALRTVLAAPPPPGAARSSRP